MPRLVQVRELRSGGEQAQVRSWRTPRTDLSPLRSSWAIHWSATAGGGCLPGPFQRSAGCRRQPARRGTVART